MNIPARKLKRSAVKNIVRFPAIKANDGKTILVESILESKYCLHLEFDPDVKVYFPQPKTFKIPNEFGETDYTPDFEVHYFSGACYYVEVKPEEFANTGHFQQLFTRFESLLENSNMKFLLVNEIDIYQQPLLSNYEKLFQYKKRPSLNMKSLYQSVEKINNSMPLSCLIDKLGDSVKLREIYSWLALGYLSFNMRSEKLTMMSEVKFNVS